MDLYFKAGVLKLRSAGWIQPTRVPNPARQLPEPATVYNILKSKERRWQWCLWQWRPLTSMLLLTFQDIVDHVYFCKTFI